MGFAFFFFFTWLIITIFIVMKKELSLIENTFVFLVVLTVGVNISWIIEEELKLISVTNNGIDYTAFLLNRSVIFPLLLITQINFLKRGNSFTWTLITTFCSVVVMIGLNALATYFHILEYKNWNFGYDAIYFIFLHLVAYLALKIFKNVSENEVSYS